ncbi:MAG: PKD domain-containing protein [Bacteroidota bacterium]
MLKLFTTLFFESGKIRYCLPGLFFLISGNLLMTSINQLKAQCPNNNSYYLDLTPTGPGNTQSSACTYGGEYNTFTACAGAEYTITTCGDAAFDTQITIYEPDGVTVAGYSDDYVGCSPQSEVTFTASVAGLYYVVLDEYNCATNAICMSISVTQNTACGGGSVSNDDPCDAISLAVGASCTFGTYTNAGATNSGIANPGCASYSGGDVWFNVTVPASGHLIFDSNTGVITDGGMAIYSGTCSSLTLIACDDDGSLNGNMPMIDQTGLTPGSTIWIRFWEYGNNNNGTFDICVYDGLGVGGVPNQYCADAIELCGPQTVTGTTQNALNQSSIGPPVSQWSCNSVYDNYVYYTFQTDGVGSTVVIDITTPGCDANSLQVAIFESPPTPCVSSADWGLSVYCSESTTAFTINAAGLSPNTTYYIVIDNWPANYCNFTFNISGNDPCSSTPCTGTTPGCASPPPDECPNACALGTLSSPVPCPTNTPVDDVFCLNNIGATAANPYSYLVGCQPSGDMASPAADVWYTFVASANIIDVNITGDLNNPSVGLYEGPNCSNLIGRGCANGSGGSLTATFQPMTPGSTYYLQISGGNVSDQGDFILTITSYNDCDPCLITSNLTTSPPPNNGAYNAGQTVTFCFNVTEWDQTAVNWIHGVVPTFGAGWDMSSLVPNPPPTCDGNGSWGWYNSVTGENTGNTYGPGFFYESTLGCFPCDGSDPGDNFGDNCTGIVDWEFCWDITVADCPPNSSGTSLNISIDTYGDAESGSWGSMGCESDPIYTFFATATCCEQPIVSVDQNVSCNNGNNGQATATGQGSAPFTYSWNTSPVQNNATATGLPAGTYTVTVTDDIGCVATENVTITEPSAISVSITPADATCNLACDGTLSASASGGTPGYTYSWNGGLGTGPNKTGVCAGNYTVTVTDGNGCTQTASATISQPPALTVTPGAVDESCNNACDGSVSATANGGTPAYTFNWSGGLGGGANHSNLCDGSYTVTVTDANGCTTNASVTVNPGGVITAGFTYNGNQCLTGNNFVFTNTGTSVVTYSWDFGDGMGTSTIEDPSYSYSTPGSYTVTQTVSNGGCSDTYSLVINVYAEPVVSVAGADITCNSICNGLVTSTVSSGTPAYTYSWSPGGGTGPSFTDLCPGTYTLIVTDANNCTGTDNATITEPPLLTSITSGNDASCNSACDGDATVTPAGGSPPYTYQWDGGTGFQTTAVATGLCAGTFNVTISDANGCTANNSYIVNEPSAMVLTPSTVDANCGSSDGSASVTVSGGNSPYTYSWNSSPVQTTSNATGLPSGSYTVTVTDANGCTETAAANINDVGGGGTASITVNDNASCNGTCDGQTTASISGGNPPFTYLWDDPLSQTTTTATGLCAGNYSVSITDALGCMSVASTTITEPPALNAAITSSNDANCNGSCDGDATVSASGGTGVYTYSWSPGGGTNVTGTGLCAGTLYTVTVTDANGCNTTASVTIGEPAMLTASVTTTDVSCTGSCNGSAAVTASGGTGSYTYLWSDPGSQTAATAIGLCAGTFTVTVTDANGCDTTANGVINEPPPLTLSPTVTDAFCGMDNGVACASPSGGTPPYTYLWDDISSQTTDCATALPSGTYNVTVTDANGCSASTTSTINDIPGGIPVITLDANASGFGICDGQATVSMGGTSPFTYLWDDPSSQTTATAGNLCAGNWCVTVTDAMGCTGSDCITITEPPSIIIVIVGVNIDCNGDCNGSADLTVSGGLPPYTYLWTGGYTIQDISGVCAGMYIVTVTDANSISVTDSIDIKEPDQITIPVTGNDATCNGSCDGDATASASGGFNPYTYLWDDPSTQSASNASGLCAGTYNVTVTDANGCTETNSITINEPPTIIVNVTTITANCGLADGSATANVTNGIAPFTYNWTNGCSSQTCTNLSAGIYTVTVTDSNGCTATDFGTVGNAGGPSAQIQDSVDVSCPGGNDGSATVQVTDGIPPYTYLWNPSGITNDTATGLSSGSYAVLITDANGCITTVSVYIDEPPILAATATLIAEPSCNGVCDGIATVAASGGTPPYSYQWDDPGSQTTTNATGLCAGSVTVTATDANSCVASDNIILNEPAPLVLTIVETDATCAGVCDGNATVSVTGGIPPYSYSWSNGDNAQFADSLCNGVHNITVIDNNGCIAISSFIINAPAAVTVLISSFSDVDCNGNCNGYAQSAPSGGSTPYTYLWSDGQPNDQAIGLCAGFYCITVTDANGCLDTACVTISEPPALTGTITSGNVNCFGDCDGIASVSVSGGNSPYTYLWTDPSFQTTLTADSLCAGTYSVIITDAEGCIITRNVTIIQPQLLGLVGSSVSSTCGNPNGQASVSVIGGVVPYTIVWNDPGNTTGLSIYNIYASVYNPIVTDGNGCTYTVPVIVNDIAGAVIDSVTTTDLNCSGDGNGTAEVFISGGTTPFTYIWQDNNGDTITIGVTFIFGLSGGTYTTSVIDANDCTNSFVFSINEPSSLASAIISSNDVSCYGACDGEATAIAGGGTLPYSYLWSPGGYTTASATGLCFGINNVAITDANGCLTSTSVDIIQPDELMIIPTVTDVNCFNGNDGQITLIPTPSGGTAPYTYNWSPVGNGATVTNLSAGSYTVTVTDINNCTLTENITVNEPAVISISLSGDSSTCGNANGEVTAVVSGGTGAYTYQWDDPGLQTNSTATGLTAGFYTVTVTDNNYCSSSKGFNIGDMPAPVIDVVVLTNVVCNGGNTGSATVTTSLGTSPFTYQWDDPASQATPTATGLQAGTISVVVTDFNNCIASDYDIITEPTPVQVTINGNTQICIGESTVITAQASGGTPPYEYIWNNNLDSSASHSVSPDSTTIYTVQAMTKDGCKSPFDSITVNVYPPLQLTVTSVTICVGDDAILTAYASGGNGGTYTFLWSNGATSSSQTIPGLTTNTTFNVILSDNCSPEDTAYAYVTVHPTPVASFAWACEPDPYVIQFSDSSTADDSIISWLWDFGDGDTTGQQHPAHIYSQSDNYTVSLTVYSVQGCYNSASVVVQSPPTADFFMQQNDIILPPPAQTSILSPTIEFIDASSNSVILWQWDFGDPDTDTANSSLIQNPQHTYLDPGIYIVSLTVTDDNGCMDEITQPVTFEAEYTLFAPNAFSVNSKVEENMYFRPKIIGVDNDAFEIYIYDRWGDMIYQYTGSYDEWPGWDGKANQGKDFAQMDVYVWLIRLEDLNWELHEYVGHLTLIR